MAQLLEPDAYAALELKDQWIEDVMQQQEAKMLLERLYDCHTILDLGYGSGIVCAALAGAGKAVTVVEGSRAGYEAASAIKGCNAVLSLFEDYQPEGRFDAVIASFVLEHVVDPVALLKRCHQWSDRLIVVIGNAESFHRKLAFQMGLIKSLDELSERDKAVGHYRVYSHASIVGALMEAGWWPFYPGGSPYSGIMLKPLPNSLLAKLPQNVVRALCEVDLDSGIGDAAFKNTFHAANLLIHCVPSPNDHAKSLRRR